MEITIGSSPDVAAGGPIVPADVAVPLRPPLQERKMKVRYVATLFLLLLVPSRGLAFPDAIEKGPTGHSHVETYRYGAVAAGKETDKEEIELTLAFEEDSSAYVSTIVSVKSYERITVPAGEFSCYRMEVLVHTFILSPTIVCWVTTEKPHFVVRSEGKRGIFTPKYITTLIGRQ